jgi:hypothetical protein
MSYVIDSVVDSAFEGVGKIASHHGWPTPASTISITIALASKKSIAT